MTDLKGRARALLEGVIEGDIDLPDGTLVFLDAETLLSVVTPKRLELLDIIGKKNPSSVNDLAMMAGRLKQAVVRDLKSLELHDIVKLDKRGRTVTPVLKNSVVLFSLVGPTMVKGRQKARQTA